MTFNLVRFVVAVIIAAFVGLIFVNWLGPLLNGLNAGPITEVTGKFFSGPAGWIIGLLAGALWYIKGNALPGASV